MSRQSDRFSRRMGPYDVHDGPNSLTGFSSTGLVEGLMALVSLPENWAGLRELWRGDTLQA